MCACAKEHACACFGKRGISILTKESQSDSRDLANSPQRIPKAPPQMIIAFAFAFALDIPNGVWPLNRAVGRAYVREETVPSASICLCLCLCLCLLSTISSYMLYAFAALCLCLCLLPLRLGAARIIYYIYNTEEGTPARFASGGY